MAQEITKASPTDSGCWIDGHWGQYGSARLIEIAAENGWSAETVAPTDQVMVADAIDVASRKMAAMLPSDAEDISDEEDEWLFSQGGAGDAAETWLNENIAPEGFSFGWHDGEFFLWSTETWEEESY